MYDGELEGYISTLNLAEFRYITARETSVEQANTHINDLQNMGVTEYNIDDLWEVASNLNATYSPSLGDAYPVGAAKDLDDDDERDVRLLIGADDDYDVFENDEEFTHLIERFRDTPA